MSKFYQNCLKTLRNTHFSSSSDEEEKTTSAVPGLGKSLDASKKKMPELTNLTKKPVLKKKPIKPKAQKKLKTSQTTTSLPEKAILPKAAKQIESKKRKKSSYSSSNDSSIVTTSSSPHFDSNLKNLPTKEYLDQTITSILLFALSALVIERPFDPIDFVANYLIREKRNFTKHAQE